MKKYFIILLVAVIGFGCAGSKVVYSPVGSWDYVVSGTPNGDVQGIMVLTETEDVLSGKFVSDQGDLPLENVNYTEEKQLTARFYFEGMEFSMTGTFEGETFAGTIDGGDQIGLFSMTANRKPVN